MRPETYLPVLLAARPSLQSPESPRPSSHGIDGKPAALRHLATAVVLLLLSALAPAALFAQQAPYPGQGWPQNDPNNDPNNAQYPPPDQQPPYPQPAYPQQQPYAQQPYAASAQPYPQQGGYPGSYPDQGYGQPQPSGQPLNAEQLEQLIAPIALYPDSLVAQMLAAATYPAQVVAADHWLQAQGYASPDQIAAGADAQTWDPSVKALTAFPQVLAQMDRNLQWTTDLGNAYYNQPQDVLQTVQLMRQRAQAAGNMQSSPQEAVSNDQGYIELAPPNPQVVYVPAYNPWVVYGQPVSPYPGFSLFGALGGALGAFAGSGPLRFGTGIGMAGFSHTSFGWLLWGLDWLGQSVLFNHSNYYSHSTSVARWGYPRSGPIVNSERRAMAGRPQGYDRNSGYNGRSGNGYGNGYNRAPAQTYVRPSVRNPQDYAASRPYAGSRPAEGFSRSYQAPGSSGYYARPPQAYNRPQPQAAIPARPQQYAYGRGAYGSGYYGGAGNTYGSRPAQSFAAPQNYRAPAPGYARSDPGMRFSQAFAGSYGKPEHSGGFHLFGHSHESESYRAPRAPKSYGGGKGFSSKHSGGGGHSGGGKHHR